MNKVLYKIVFRLSNLFLSLSGCVCCLNLILQRCVDSLPRRLFLKELNTSNLFACIGVASGVQ